MGGALNKYKNSRNKHFYKIVKESLERKAVITAISSVKQSKLTLFTPFHRTLAVLTDLSEPYKIQN